MKLALLTVLCVNLASYVSRCSGYCSSDTNAFVFPFNQGNSQCGCSCDQDEVDQEELEKMRGLLKDVTF